MLNRLAFEHLFRYEAARAASDERAMVFAVLELPQATEALLARCATVVARTLGQHDMIGHWGDGLVVIFHASDLPQACAALERAFARVREATGVALAGVVRVVRERPAANAAHVAIAELA